MPTELRPLVGNWLFGCDVCQDVCPWNRAAGSRPVPFPADPELASLDLHELLALSEQEFRRRFKPTPLFRPKWNGLRRNAAVVLGNTGDEQSLVALEPLLSEPDPIVREAAEWAVDRIRQRLRTNPHQPA